MSRGRAAFAGQIADLSVRELLRTIVGADESGVARFETNLGTAAVWFRAGQLVDADMGRFHMEDAVRRLINADSGSFEVEFKPITRRHVITTPAHELIDGTHAGPSSPSSLGRQRRQRRAVAGWEPTGGALTPTSGGDAGSGPTTAAPSRPITVAPSGPIQAAPSGPITVAPSGPIQAAPSGPITVAPSGPIRAAPSGPIAVAPSRPIVVPPPPPLATGAAAGRPAALAAPRSFARPQAPPVPAVPPSQAFPPKGARPPLPNPGTPPRVAPPGRARRGGSRVTDSAPVAGKLSRLEDMLAREEPKSPHRLGIEIRPGARAGSIFPPRASKPPPPQPVPSLPRPSPVVHADDTDEQKRRTQFFTGFSPAEFERGSRKTYSLLPEGEPTAIDDDELSGPISVGAMWSARADKDAAGAEQAGQGEHRIASAHAKIPGDPLHPGSAADSLVSGAIGAQSPRPRQSSSGSVADDRNGARPEHDPPAPASTQTFAVSGRATPARRTPAEGGAAVGPAVVGRYEVLLRIARGGMGTVYLCRVTGEGGFRRLFALKVIRDHLSRNDDYVEMLLQEARIASRLHHPNVVGIVDIGKLANQHFLVMDYVEGCTFSELLKVHRKSRPPHLIIPIMLDALTGLHAAHTLVGDDGAPLTLVHCDFSPQNMLVGTNGICRITDFGIAKAADVLDSRRHVTRGKPAYLSPEQITGESIDNRSDVFAAGVVLWNALTGEQLFSGESPEDTLWQVLHRDVPPPSTVGLRPPSCFDRICMRALARDPAQRYQSAEAMLIDLRRVAIAEDFLAPSSEVARWVGDTFGAALELRMQAAGISTKPRPEMMQFAGHDLGTDPGDSATAAIVHAETDPEDAGSGTGLLRARSAAPPALAAAIPERPRMVIIAAATALALVGVVLAFTRPQWLMGGFVDEYGTYVDDGWKVTIEPQPTTPVPPTPSDPGGPAPEPSTAPSTTLRGEPLAPSIPRATAEPPAMAEPLVEAPPAGPPTPSARPSSHPPKTTPKARRAKPKPKPKPKPEPEPEPSSAPQPEPPPGPSTTPSRPEPQRPSQPASEAPAGRDVPSIEPDVPSGNDPASPSGETRPPPPPEPATKRSPPPPPDPTPKSSHGNELPSVIPDPP